MSKEIDDAITKALDEYNKKLERLEQLETLICHRNILNYEHFWPARDPDYLAENNPEEYERLKQNMIKNSKLYEPPKEEKKTELSDWDDSPWDVDNNKKTWSND